MFVRTHCMSAPDKHNLTCIIYTCTCIVFTIVKATNKVSPIACTILLHYPQIDPYCTYMYMYVHDFYTHVELKIVCVYVHVHVCDGDNDSLPIYM